MKYLQLREVDKVTSALNFDTSDCHVVGGCDLYITKAASTDKKLYKSIETSLESQHESLVRVSKSLSPPHADLFNLDLSRSSPFGPLSQVSSRRLFAYLIATLNASHPDYDFSQILRPSDFKREKYLRSVMTTIDETLYNLRPRPAVALLAQPNGWATKDLSHGPSTPGGSQLWGPKMWRTVDKEMSLRECDIYSYTPEEDPFDGEDTAIWSHHYFFFNKDRKRVCYLYVRGLSMLSHSPSRATTQSRPKRARAISQSLSAVADEGAGKRARYWLGDRARQVVDSWADEDDSNVETIQSPGDDEVDADETLGGSDGSFHAGYSDSDDYDVDDEIERRFRDGDCASGMSEHIAETMDL